MSEGVPKTKSSPKESLRESLILQLEELVILPPGYHLSLAPREFIELSKEEKAKKLKEVLVGLRDSIEYLSRYSTEEHLLATVKLKKMRIITTSLEAKLLSPQDVAEFLD